MWYMAPEPYHVSVLRIGVRYLGGGQMVSSTLYQPNLLEGLSFLDLTRAFDIGSDLT